jgi:selenocysteine lyase/cysteine desulfurase
MELDQVIVGGTGIRSDLRLHPREMPTRLEAGTPNVPALAGLAAALRWHDECGEKNRELEILRSEQLRNGLRAIPRVHIYGDAFESRAVGIVSFSIEGWEIEEIGFVLSESFGILCRTGLHCAPLIHEPLGSAPEGTVRFSPSAASTEDEIEQTLAAVRRLAG